MKEFSIVHNLKIPSHVSIQNWVLKCGNVGLGRPSERRTDWVFILDHMVEFGTQKCFLVLGVPLGLFRQNQCKVKHADVRVIGVVVADKMNAAKVTAALTEFSKASGMPVQIVTDHGSDIKKGVEDFITASPFKPVYTYDITHKSAIILKWLLKDCPAWERFVRQCVEAKRLVLQTEMGHLAPPKPSDKARWLNLDTYASWGQAVAAHMAEARLDPERREEAERLTKFFGWLDGFAPELIRWGLIVKTLQAAKSEVKLNGLDKASTVRLTERLEEFNGGAADVAAKLCHFLEKESAALPDDKKWLGTSDIIESVFGKYKRFSQRATIKGIGKMVLTIPAFTGQMDMAKVGDAMEAVKCADVAQWINNNLGTSLFAKRRKAIGAKLKSKCTVKFPAENLKKAASF